ncbi:hypothetical protein ARAF_0726 [Arsenophonus endosymbiont of Aleurodicus floccissimus]|nr:hypothetical protein ARAF_0726 [Arsenophonus endosymbiont of Aleurodicus floccissimus]
MNTNDEILLTHHVVALLKCSVRKVRRFIKEGELPARRRGKETKDLMKY